MKLKANPDSNFTPHPESDCIGVCVDVTPLKRVESAYGPRDIFKLVFESDQLREDGRPYLVWSRSFTPSLHEKAAFRAFVKQWFGRDLNAKELAEFDTESLVGRTAKLSIVHNEYNGNVYANIGLIRPDRSTTPLKASGKYVRVQDRDEQNDETFRSADGGGDDDGADWRRTKVHVGKHTGLDLGDLDEDSVRALIERWLPDAMANPKPLKADRELIAGLRAAADVLGIEVDEDNNEPF
jgi:hypothetical protein